MAFSLENSSAAVDGAEVGAGIGAVLGAVVGQAVGEVVGVSRSRATEGSVTVVGEDVCGVHPTSLTIAGGGEDTVKAKQGGEQMPGDGRDHPHPDQEAICKVKSFRMANKAFGNVTVRIEITICRHLCETFVSLILTRH